MKKILAAIIITSVFHTAEAQLANTNWKGTVVAGGGTLNIIWKLATDTASFYNSDDNALLDVSVFKVQDSTVNLRKISGLSGCGEEMGLYKFEIKDNTLTLYLKKDDCTERSDILDKVTFTRILD